MYLLYLNLYDVWFSKMSTDDITKVKNFYVEQVSRNPVCRAMRTVKPVGAIYYSMAVTTIETELY